MEAAILGALLASSVAAALVLALVGRTSAPPRLRLSAPLGRLRLPARTFERAVVVAVLAGAGALAPTMSDAPAVIVGAVAVAVVVGWTAQRGVFLSPRATEDAEER